MWRIERIELENFRSYKGRHVVSLGDVNILWGRIGAGKTSLLYAVEYALYGRQLEVKERVAKLLDLINVEAHEMRVSLVLSDGGRLLEIERRLGRRGDEKIVVRINGEELRGREAERRLEELLGADEDIYERLIYISHRTLEGFIYGTSQKRSLTVDRLFGIDVIDSVVRVVSSVEKSLLAKAEELRGRLAAYEKYKEVIRRYGGFAGVKKRLEDLTKEVETLEEREAALSRDAEDLARKRAEHLAKLREHESMLLEYYKTRSELEVLESATEGGTYDLSTVEKLRDALREAVEEFEHVVGEELAEKLSKAGDVESLSIAMMDAYNALSRLQNELEAQIAEAKKLYEQYSARVRKIDEEIAEARDRLRRLEKYYARFKELQKTIQSVDSARASLAELRRQIQTLEREVSYSSALRVVALYAAETGAEKCPICGAPVRKEDLLRRVEEVEARHGTLIKEVEELKERASQLEKAVEEAEALSGEVAEYLAVKTRLEELETEREEAAKKALQAEKSLKQLEKKTERLRLLLARVDRRTISDTLAKYGRAVRIRELRKRLREIEDSLKRIGITSDVISIDVNWREVVEELEKTSRRLAEAYRERALLEEVVREVGENAEALKKKLDNALYAYGKLQEVKAKLELAKINARARLLEVARSRFNEVFTSLYRYGDIVRVDADLEQRRGFYDFHAITPSGDRYGISKLSDGQRLSIALALALALRDIARINLGFVIFDEPIPYVDVNIRRAFAEVVKALASRFQIVVATQSREFAEMIKEAVPNALLFKVDKKESSEAVVES
ncbi:ATPase involved in DNA repair [Pyrobaculum oguniense TE7]|uniref:ATPase involved in DNA repair n=1 Tax=Pyrobaculum oguniense (strain DSM 13380 / JCM 10595 / TE7) TaxID=698757 RepID=H6Q6W6_PYROT|nr:ATPase involved in DNA repair [Pyrobaculum oguniense TE7]